MLVIDVGAFSEKNGSTETTHLHAHTGQDPLQVRVYCIVSYYSDICPSHYEYPVSDQLHREQGSSQGIFRLKTIYDQTNDSHLSRD